MSLFSPSVAGDSCGRCLQWPSEWRVAVLDGLAAQSQGASWEMEIYIIYQNMQVMKVLYPHCTFLIFEFEKISYKDHTSTKSSVIILTDI